MVLLLLYAHCARCHDAMRPKHTKWNATETNNSGSTSGRRNGGGGGGASKQATRSATKRTKHALHPVLPCYSNDGGQFRCYVHDDCGLVGSDRSPFRASLRQALDVARCPHDSVDKGKKRTERKPLLDIARPASR